MPRYDYQCGKCKHVQEVAHKMTETPVVTCERCKEYICKKLINREFAVSGSPDIADYSDIHQSKPKWLRFKDGHRERFDPTKHGHRKGAGHITSSSKKSRLNEKAAERTVMNRKLEALKVLTEQLAARSQSPENMDIVAALQQGFADVIKEVIQNREEFEALKAAKAELEAVVKELKEANEQIVRLTDILDKKD